MLPKSGASEGTACTVQRILRDDSHAHVKLMKLPLCYHALCVSVCSFLRFVCHKGFSRAG
jgi:hypothetical protein